VLLSLKLVGLTFASVYFFTPHDDILEAAKTDVCTLMNTFVFRCAIGGCVQLMGKLKKALVRDPQLLGLNFLKLGAL
jgi:hypothetical protein